MTAGIPLLLVAAGALLASPSWAQKRNRAQAVDVQVRESNDKRKKEAVKGPQKSGSFYLEPALEKKLIDGIGKTVSYLKKTVAKMPKRSGGRLKMLERILNLTIEQATYISSEEQRAYATRWDRWSKAGQVGKEPQLDARRSRVYWRDVAKMSRAVLREFPRGPNADKVNFHQALALQLLGKEKSAAKAFNRLIKYYPNSQTAGDAYFSLGDYYFNKGDFHGALNHFKAATRYRKASRYGWALFKLGWTYFNLGQYKRSLRTWQETVRYAEKKKDAGRLGGEALRDIIFAFAELRMTEAGIRYFEAHKGEEHIPGFLRILAAEYKTQGQFGSAIKTWRRLQSYLPNDPVAAKAQFDIIAVLFEARKAKHLWKELDILNRRYGPKSEWAAKVGSDEGEKVSDKARDLSLYYAKVLHKEGQDGNPIRYPQADKGYRRFLKLYATPAQKVEITEYLADIAYEMKKYGLAGKTYLSLVSLGKDKAVVRDEKGQVKENIHKRSAENMIDSFSKDFAPEFGKLVRRKPDFSKKRQDLSGRAKRFIQGCQLYIKDYPSDKKTVKTCDTFIGEIYLRTYDRENAEKQLTLVATKYAKEKEGPMAVENLIPMLKDEREKLIAIANTLFAIPAYQKGPIGKKLQALLRGVELEAIAREGNKLKRAKLYEAQARKHPTDKEVDKMWNNAAADYLAGGNLAAAVAAYGTIVQKYPKSSIYGDAVLQMAKIYDRQYRFAEAAQNYRLFANRLPKRKEAPGALERACGLQAAISLSSALSICSVFAKRYPGVGAATIERLIRMAVRANNPTILGDLVLNHYIPRFKLSPNQQVLAYSKLYRASQGRGPKAQRAANAIARLARKGVNGPALRAAAEVQFVAVESAYQNHMKKRLRGGKIEALQKSIQSILGGLANLEKRYQPVLKLKDSFWGVAVLYRLGAAYEQFAGYMKDPPNIAGAKKEEVAKQLAASVAQVDGKAGQYYAAGLKTARQFTVYNDYVPQLYNAVQRRKGSPLRFGAMVVRGDFVASEAPEDLLAQLREE